MVGHRTGGAYNGQNTPKNSPANNEQLARYNVDDDEVLKRLYGLK